MLSIENFLLNNPNIATAKKYLVAVSGGADSMVLLHVLWKCKIQIEVAHVNYQLRNADADFDAELVENFCKKNELVFHKKVVDTKKYLAENKLGLQEGARQIRYDFFKEIIAGQKIEILTAHHANDNIETVLMHIARGTGFNGLTGIPAKNNNVLRPLLGFTKAHILQYAAQHNVVFREDVSNAKNDYTRNAVRNILIPEWQKIQPNFEQNMLHNMHIWKQANNVYEKYVSQVLKKILVTVNGKLCVPINLLKKQENIGVWLFEILKKFGFTTLEIIEVQKLLQAENGKFIKNKVWRIYKDNNFLVITQVAAADNDFIVIENATETIHFNGNKLTFQIKDKPENLVTDNAICMLSADAVQFPLVLRRATIGDYFYPLGLAKKKKIAKFLIDLKLTQTQKENIWVLEEANKKIMWVVGNRIDDRFKVTNKAKQILEIKLIL